MGGCRFDWHLHGHVTFLVDVSEATINDYKIGYCSTNAFSTREVLYKQGAGIQFDWGAYW
jgi:hypothetical protein